MRHHRVRRGRRALAALAMATLGLGSLVALTGTAQAAMPSPTPDEGTTTNITANFTPTTNLVAGDVVAGTITTTDGFGGYEVKLCQHGLTGFSLTNYGYSTASGNRCVKQFAPGGISTGGLDANLGTAGIQPPTYWIPTVAGSNNPETKNFTFTVGTGSVGWYNTDGFGEFTLTCDSANPCDMVVRVSHGGNTSWYIQPLTYLAAPGNPSFAAAAGNGQATLTWAAGSGGAPSSYSLTVAPAPLSGPCAGGNCGTQSGASTGLVVTGLDNFTNYTWTLTAINGAGSSAGVNANATPAPTAPVISTLSPGNAQVQVNFSNTGANSYQVNTYDTTGPTTCGATLISTTPGGASPITVGGLTNGTNYCFKVQGVYTPGPNYSVESAAAFGGPGKAIIYQTINATRPEGVLVIAQRCAGAFGPWDTRLGDPFDPSNPDLTAPYTAQLTPDTRCNVDLSDPRSSHIVNGVTSADTRTIHDGSVAIGSFDVTSVAVAFTQNDVGQLVKVTGVPGTPRITAVVGNVATLDTAATSSFDDADVTILGTTLTAATGFTGTDVSKSIQGIQVPGGSTIVAQGTVSGLSYIDLTQPANNAATLQSVRIWDENPTPARLITSGPEAGKWLEATGKMDQVYIVDYRAADPGWSATGQADAFCAGSGPLTSGPADGEPAAAPLACNLGDATFSANQLGWAPKIRRQGGGTLVATAGATQNPTAGLGAAKPLATAAAGTGLGVARVDADLLLWIPVTSPAGNYQSTLNLTVS